MIALNSQISKCLHTVFCEKTLPVLTVCVSTFFKCHCSDACEHFNNDKMEILFGLPFHIEYKETDQSLR